MVDIHNYALKYRQAEDQVRESELSARNKELIFAYRDACLLHNTCGKTRLIRVMGALLLFARILGQEFDTVTRRDVERLLGSLLRREPAYSAQTLGTYRAILKRFLTWVLTPDAFPKGPAPPAVSWLVSHVPRKDKHRLNRNELLTPGDVQRVLDVAHNPRDRAILATLWETGGRIAEIGNLQVEHISTAEHGFYLDLDGKTGRRTVLVVSSAPYLAVWLSMHPHATDPASPVWVHYQYKRTKDTFLRYDTIRILLLKLFERAGVRKRIYPHLFRHSRATYVVASGLMTEAQAKRYFGWAPDSDMLATYAHLVDSDANNAILRENHLTPAVPVIEDLRATTCTNCKEVNLARAPFCTRCTAPLAAGAAFRAAPQASDTQALAQTLARVIIERGLLREAADAVRDAGLGDVLREHAR